MQLRKSKRLALKLDGDRIRSSPGLIFEKMMDAAVPRVVGVGTIPRGEQILDLARVWKRGTLPRQFVALGSVQHVRGNRAHFVGQAPSEMAKSAAPSV